MSLLRCSSWPKLSLHYTEVSNIMYQRNEDAYKLNLVKNERFIRLFCYNLRYTYQSVLRYLLIETSSNVRWIKNCRQTAIGTLCCNDVMAAILKVWRHINNPTQSIDLIYLRTTLPNYPDPILKKKVAPNNNNNNNNNKQMSSDMGSVPDAKIAAEHCSLEAHSDREAYIPLCCFDWAEMRPCLAAIRVSVCVCHVSVWLSRSAGSD